MRIIFTLGVFVKFPWDTVVIHLAFSRHSVNATSTGQVFTDSKWQGWTSPSILYDSLEHSVPSCCVLCPGNMKESQIFSSVGLLLAFPLPAPTEGFIPSSAASG
jgi:hypothetical protein